MQTALPILIPAPLLLAAIIAPLLGFWRSALAFPLAIASVAVATTVAGLSLVYTINGPQLHYYLGGWPPPLGIEYLVDKVSAFAATTVAGVALLVLIGSRRMALAEFPDRPELFYGLVLLMLAGITGMIVTHDLFNLFVFMEIGSLAAYSLVFAGGPRGMIAGFRYLILGSIGGGFFLLGVGFLYFATGSLNMADVSGLLAQQQDSRAVLAGAVFIFTGLGLKMALVPMHLWLPDAYTYAPSSVNALIAPVMTKVAAVAMLRMFLSVFPPGYLTDVVPVGSALVGLGLVGAVIGSVAAVSQRDYRRMLAYSSVGQLGLIGVGIGLATPLGFAAALLHVMNHAIMKGCLFLVATSVRFRTGRTDVDGMTGLGRSMPVTMGAFSVAALAMVGVPPLAGFFSKLYLAQAGIGAGNWPVFLVVLGSSLLTAVYLFRVVERAYLVDRPDAVEHPLHATPVHESMPDPPAPVPVIASPADSAADPAEPVSTDPVAHEAPLDMLLPTVALAVGALAAGLGNAAVLTFILEPGLLEWVNP